MCYEFINTLHWLSITYDIQYTNKYNNKYKLWQQVLTSDKTLIYIENLIPRYINISLQQTINDLDNKQKDWFFKLL